MWVWSATTYWGCSIGMSYYLLMSIRSPSFWMATFEISFASLYCITRDGIVLIILITNIMWIEKWNGSSRPVKQSLHFTLFTDVPQSSHMWEWKMVVFVLAELLSIVDHNFLWCIDCLTCIINYWPMFLWNHIIKYQVTEFWLPQDHESINPVRLILSFYVVLTIFWIMWFIVYLHLEILS